LSDIDARLYSPSCPFILAYGKIQQALVIDCFSFHCCFYKSKPVENSGE
jgi:hypothetical protein